MLPAERKRRIVELVTERNGCSVADLAGELDFSKATIRRDLQDLEDEGRVERSHGGAVPVSSVGREPTYDERRVERRDEKQAIASRAVHEVHDDKVVFYDGGTTTMAVARATPTGRDVTAVTNAPELATTMLDRGFDVTLTGGLLREPTRALVGPVAESFLEGRHVDLLFLGTNGIDPEAGLTTPNQDEASVKSLMVERASRVVTVADASKFGERDFVTFADLADVDLLVTDGRPDEALATALEEAGVSIAEVDA